MISSVSSSDSQILLIKKIYSIDEGLEAFINAGLINSSGELLRLPKISFPKELVEKKISALLSNTFQLSSTDNKHSFTLSFNELISFLEINPDKICLVGSSVPYLFGKTFVKQMFLSLGFDIDDSLLEEFDTPPNDYDLRVYTSKELDPLKKKVIDKLAEQKLPSVFQDKQKKQIVKETFFKKLHIQKDGDNSYATITLGPLELLVVNSIKRKALFSRDATELDIQQIPDTLPENLFQAFTAIVLKIIQAKNPETIDLSGIFIYQALLCKGYRTLDTSVQTKLVKTIQNEEIPKHFQKVVSQRFKNNPDSSVALKKHLLHWYPNTPFLEPQNLDGWILDTHLKYCLHADKTIQPVLHLSEFFLSRAVNPENKHSQTLIPPLNKETLIRLEKQKWETPPKGKDRFFRQSRLKKSVTRQRSGPKYKRFLGNYRQNFALKIGRDRSLSFRGVAKTARRGSQTFGPLPTRNHQSSLQNSHLVFKHKS